MHLTTVTYERRLTDGNYGNRTIHLVAELDQGDEPHEALDHLRALAHIQLARDADEEQAEHKRRAEQEQRLRYRDTGAAHHPAPIGTGDGSTEGLQ